MQLTPEQLSVIESPIDSKIFYEGPAGTGKTTAGVGRLSHLVESGVPGRTILLFFPQRNLGSVYQKSYNEFSKTGTSLPILETFGGLSRRILDLFWPSIIQASPQLQADIQPTFLTLESSLFFLSKVVEPLILEEGYFSTVVIQRNRLYSQILDNLNKAAVHAFSHEEIAQRLSSSWIGDPSQAEIFIQAQHAASLFREYCLQNNLLDYSLQIELFNLALDQIPLVNEYIVNQFDHMIYDNSEEDIPVSHDFIHRLSSHLESYLIICDHDAGYRSFLGASPDSAMSLAEICSDQVTSGSILTASPTLQSINSRLSAMISGDKVDERTHSYPAKDTFSINFQSSYPELVDWVAKEANTLIESGVPPSEIVILAPYLSDSLRFLLTQALDKYSIPTTSHRPSRALREEPVTQALLILAALSHPAWEIYPSIYELALAFVQIINDLDLTRAYLMAEQAVKQSPTSSVQLADFEDFPESYQERISYYSGSLYQKLVDWMKDYVAKSNLPLDHFLAHLFGEVLSTPGFGFHNDLTKARISSQIIDSVKFFRNSVSKVLRYNPLETGQEYYLMVKSGVLANQYISSWTDKATDELLISPAYTFLLNNQPVDYQFWLDIGSRGWYERIYQPLTNPHILKRDWPLGKPWTDEDEQSQNRNSLNCVTTGLIRRCRKSIFGCLTELDERGYEQKGSLLLALKDILLDVQLPDSMTGSIPHE